MKVLAAGRFVKRRRVGPRARENAAWFEFEMGPEAGK
jgi:hypothetical protein